MDLNLNNKAFRILKLNLPHVQSLALLSTVAPHSVAQHATAMGITIVEAQHRLSLLIDEELAIQDKDPHNKPLDSFKSV